ncbi:MAG: hypothetical protein H6Q90_6379, partial [Deltaproteobacteria bacterium]|nr:hypothetical protein [Deltaproteobacteria bacterium]
CDLAVGTCVPEASVVYASPDGMGTCSLAQPCALASAITLATNAVVTPTVRMLPGTYDSSLEVRTPTAAPLEVVATQADILVVGSVRAVVVKDGASVNIRNLSATGELLVQCGNANAPFSSLSIRGASFKTAGAASVVDMTRCNLNLTDSEVSMNASGSAITTSDDSSLRADRVHMHANIVGATIIVAGARTSVEITNSLLENVFPAVFTSDTTSPGSRLTFAYDTFVLSHSLDQGAPGDICEGSTVALRSVLFENSVLASQGAFESVGNLNPLKCTFTNTILSHQTGAPPGTIVVDPQFIDVANRDFHLKPSSPAIDIAVSGTINVGHDLDGTLRPQGSSPDLGAYEHHP